MTDPSHPKPADDREGEGALDPTATLVFPKPKLEGRQPAVPDRVPIHVEVVGGPMDGLAERKQAPVLTIGRALDNDLSVPMDAMVSTHHARITCEGRTCFLEDLGSRNGTLIGDRPIEGRVPLGPGATFVVGRTRIELLSR